MLANPAYFRGPIEWSNKRDAGQAGRRGRNDPATEAGSCRVDDDLETELFNEEPPASLLISNPNRGKIQPEKWRREYGGMRVTRNVPWFGCAESSMVVDYTGT